MANDHDEITFINPVISGAGIAVSYGAPLPADPYAPLPADCRPLLRGSRGLPDDAVRKAESPGAEGPVDGRHTEL
jgi:hypothetical protein